jgi:hypothetical protein
VDYLAAKEGLKRSESELAGLAAVVRITLWEPARIGSAR